MSMKSDIDAMIASIKPSRPIFKLEGREMNEGNLYLQKIKMHNVTSDLNSKIVDNLMGHIYERIVDKKHVIQFQGNPVHIIQYNIGDFFIRFLVDHLGGSNNRLTSIYQWYKRFGGSTDTPENFRNDLFGVYKYLYDRTDPLTEIDIKNGLGLLQIIKNRYEAKGMTR